MVSLIDLVPTIVRFCGGDPASILQGIDFGDLIRGADHAVNDGVAAEFHSVNWTDPLHPLRMWVGERWKYVESQDDSDELYDLHDDPLEMINLIESPAHALALEQARRGLGSWITSTGDSWPSVIQPPPRPPTLNAPTRS